MIGVGSGITCEVKAALGFDLASRMGLGWIL